VQPLLPDLAEHATKINEVRLYMDIDTPLHTRMICLILILRRYIDVDIDKPVYTHDLFNPPHLGLTRDIDTPLHTQDLFQSDFAVK